MMFHVLLYKDFAAQKQELTTTESYFIFLCTGEWCPPCKVTKQFLFSGDVNYRQNTIYKFFTSLAETEMGAKLIHKKIILVIVDVDKDDFDVSAYGVRSIPTFLVTDHNMLKIHLEPGAIKDNTELQKRFLNILSKVISQ